MRYFIKVLIGVSVVLGSWVLLSQKSCQSDSGFRVEHSARMGSDLLLSIDTTKPPKTYNHYTLSGSDTLFRILFTQVQSPGDVTPNELSKLKTWLSNSIKIDTTK